MFNDKQLKAINTLNGRVRVIAAAGSGKTKVLTERYIKLSESGIEPKNILAVTFTNKAAQEMKDRIEKRIGKFDSSLICTFHSFCLKILRNDIDKLGYPKKFTILDSDDQKTILKKIYKECKIDYKEISYTTAEDIITERKVKYEDKLEETFTKDAIIETLYNDVQKKINEGDFKDYKTILKDCIYYGYLYYQQKNNSLDFNDMIILAVNLFKKEHGILKRWQNQLKYIMVDEFQDASKRQSELVEMLSKKHGNLFVVGDPDQTIYTWRGAKPEILVDFKADTDIVMNQNYRSTPEILDVANIVIDKNELRVKKDLFTENKSGEKVWFRHFSNSKDEADWIARSIDAALKTYKPQDIAVLYRTHYLSRQVEEGLVIRHIPYVIHSGTNFYERQEVKDILAYLRLLINPHDDIALERVINIPKRNMGNAKVNTIKSIAKETGKSLWSVCFDMPENKYGKVQEFLSVLRSIYYWYESDTPSLTEVVLRVLKKTGYDKYLKDSLEPEREENIQELIKAIGEFDDKSIDEYLQEVTLMTNVDKKNKSDCVTLMTIHSSKGLEYPIVFVTGLTEGVFPSRRAEDKEQQEEERRLAYVAYTRAKERLFLTDSDGMDFNSRPKHTSVFVKDIFDKLDSNVDLEDIENEITILKPTYQNHTPLRAYVVKKEGYSGLKHHGQYFQNGRLYDWDDETYLQGSVDAEDILDEGDFC